MCVVGPVTPNKRIKNKLPSVHIAIHSAPTIIAKPMQTSYKSGSKVNITCSSTLLINNTTPLTYDFAKNGDEEILENLHGSPRINTIVLDPVLTAHAGVYTCQAMSNSTKKNSVNSFVLNGKFNFNTLAVNVTSICSVCTQRCFNVHKSSHNFEY